MLVPPSRKMASILLSAISRRAFSIRFRRSSSPIGATGGSGRSPASGPGCCASSGAPVSIGPMLAPATIPALRPTKPRLSISNLRIRWSIEKREQFPDNTLSCTGRKLSTMQRISWLFLLAVAHGVRAQANVSGVVRDSIARGPLAGAIVQLVSAEDASRFARSTASDSLGRFAFSEVPSGRYTLGFFHPRLDSLGVDAAAREVLVSGRSDVHADLAIPGPLRLGRAICRNALRDSSGVVVGVVRDARTLNPVAKANVVGEWLELAFTTQGVVRRMPRLVATTGDNGWFALCNVPSGGTIAL